ncbi:MAG: hypothetical protein J7M26_02865, partial [Armatimonadetes bacterium]|nr:hypothetical protein [Armatimonadota bacterium]
VVWCGNNEIEWGDWDWNYDRTQPTHPHYALFHHDLPAIAAAEAPHTPYWLSSPYSPDFKHPNDPTVGDQHPWKVSIQAENAWDFWMYRSFVDRFPNEGGVIGASSPATLRQFLPEGERYVGSPSWDHHDNPMACLAAEPGAWGRAYQLVINWLGLDPFELELEDYAFASALLQAEGLSEYIVNYRRRMFSSASAIFWMYNDSWPVSHGWTIVDYYLRRKLAYHPVRRAFSPVTVVVADLGADVAVFGVNDTPQDWTGTVQFGLFTLDGELPISESRHLTLPANSSTPIGHLRPEQWKELGVTRAGAFGVLTSDEGRLVAQHRLFLARFKDLELKPATVEVSLADGLATFRSDVFVWGACVDVDGEKPLADNCFDLLPAVPYTVAWAEELGEPQVLRTGNGLLAGPP